MLLETGTEKPLGNQFRNACHLLTYLIHFNGHDRLHDVYLLHPDDRGGGHAAGPGPGQGPEVGGVYRMSGPVPVAGAGLNPPNGDLL